MRLSAGAQLGPYEITGVLGSGGMGEVYKATDTRLGRAVAIKLVDGKHLERFAREARAIAALNHPHICTLHDIGPDYLVMEYVEGKPLHGPLPLDESVRLALQIAGALEAAHAKGIVHRDLKPANIMVTRAGVKLLDFGLAKLDQDGGAADATLTQTQAGMILGTAAYMSPEQAEGKAADARADVFSFGVVLYEMVSGRRAFGGENSVSTMAAVLHREPEPLASSPEIARIVKRCLRKAAADRYQTMAEIRAALEAVTTAPAAKAPSVAVLPFANMSGDKENEYFSDGLAEEIINALTKVPGLKVAARTSAFAFRGKNDDIRKIGEALSVDHVLEGSVRKSGNRVRVTAQLIAIADGCHLWSERYDREMNDIFAIQDEVSQAIVEVLRIKLALPGQTVVRRQTTVVGAYQAYLEGRYFYEQFTEASIRRSRDCYERAISLDPEYALPHAGLAESCIYETLYGATPPNDVIPTALAAAERAIQLDPEAPEGYVARGFIRGACQYQWEAGRADYFRALELNPDSPRAHYRLGVWYFMPVGRFQEGVAEAQRSVELDPLSMLSRNVLALLLHMAGRDDEAVPQCRSALEMFPDAFLSSFLAGLVLGGCGLFDDAASVLERGLRLDPQNPWLTAEMAGVRAGQGDQKAVAGILAEVEARAAREHVPPVAIAMTHAAAGNLDEAFAWLDKAVEVRHIWTIPYLQSPMFSRMLAGPRFDALQRKMNLSGK